MARPPLHSLQGFVAAARHGNLTRAAESLHLTVSALSHQMRALEAHMGYPLLRRTARGVSPTADGQRLLDQVAPHLDAIARALHPYSARRDNVLTISLLPSMASAWLVPRLAGFLSAHPTVEINLQSTVDVVDFARAADVDAALRIGLGEWPGAVAEHLFDEWLVPMASPALVERMGGVGAKPLAQWPLVGDLDGQWARWFELDGVGVVLGRLTRARLLLDSGQLLPLSPRRLRTRSGHWLVHPERSRTHAGFRVFREWLLAQAAEHARHVAAAP